MAVELDKMLDAYLVENLELKLAFLLAGMTVRLLVDLMDSLDLMLVGRKDKLDSRKEETKAAQKVYLLADQLEIEKVLLMVESLAAWRVDSKAVEMAETMVAQ